MTPFLGLFCHLYTYDLSLILKCSMEGLGLAFQTQPQLSANPGQKNEVYAQVNVFLSISCWFLCHFHRRSCFLVLLILLVQNESLALRLYRTNVSKKGCVQMIGNFTRVGSFIFIAKLMRYL